MTVSKEEFGQMPDGTIVDCYRLSNSKGSYANIITYGAIIQALNVPDRDGNLDDVVLGFNDLKGYLNNTTYIGAVAGRYANRIANGKFSIADKEYTLAVNNGPNHLHGGLQGLNSKVWQVEEVTDNAVKLSYLSIDREEGYPGNLQLFITYSFSEDNTLEVAYSAECDKSTVLNLTQHTYFNLLGEGGGDILDHDIMINADNYTPVVDANSIPTGEIASVTGTPMDFTIPKKIGEDISNEHEQITFGNGYDHNFVLNDPVGVDGLATRVSEEKSGRILEVYTTEPGLQLYTANYLDGTDIGKQGIAHQKRHAFCLETQHFPDSPNQDNFPTTILNPGETYQQITKFKFSAK